MTSVADIPAVRKTITINASVEHAFRVFTEGHDSWWPWWDPPHRLVLAWQITHEWGYEPDPRRRVRSTCDSPRSLAAELALILSIVSSSVTVPGARRCGPPSTRRAAGAACSRCSKRGRSRRSEGRDLAPTRLLVSTEGSTVLLLPSLAIDKRTAARGLDILARSI